MTFCDNLTDTQITYIREAASRNPENHISVAFPKSAGCARSGSANSFPPFSPTAVPLKRYIHTTYSICFSLQLLRTERIGHAQLLIATTCDLCAHVLGPSHPLTTSSLFVVALGSFYAGQLDAQGLGEALRCSREKLSRAIESL